MDKKNTIIGVALLLAAFASYFYSTKFAPPAPKPATQISSPAALSGTTGAAPTGETLPTASPYAAAITAEVKEAEVTTLTNEFVEVHLTNFGGAIRDVGFKKYPAVNGRTEPYLFNSEHANPMLAFVDFPGLDRRTGYQLVSKTEREVVYRAVFENRIEVTRRYVLPTGLEPGTDPYQIRQQITFRNLTDQTVTVPRVTLSLGTAAPLDVDDKALQLTTGYYDGEDSKFTHRSALEGGGLMSFIGIGARDPVPSIDIIKPIKWASVSNRFFTSILTPDEAGTGTVTRRVELPFFAGSNHPNFGLTATTHFDVKALAPQGEQKLGLSLYVGPKEYKRLSNNDVFKDKQDRVMEYGFFAFFGKILLTIMAWMHGLTNGWGLAIILTTLSLKIVFLPLTLSASKSAKRMQKIQPEMTALKEKFKDNPQKMQAATMELFKKYRVNPVGGCIPILLTMPFFFGFYGVLNSTAEFRFEHFLWAADLSATDTVANIPLFGFHLPINIMPILMGITTMVQMRLVPQPSIDNAQAKILKLMPLMFIAFCYFFSCALALYSTVNGLFTIGQQLIINRMKDEPLAPAPVAATAGGRGVKNVTPKKK